jgi:two-component system response regulator AtoC
VKKPRVLIIDDEQSITVSLTLALRGEFDVHAALTAAEGLEAFRTGSYQLVLLDLRIGGDDGLQVLERLKAISEKAAVIVITAFGTIRSSVDAMKKGAFTYLSKPVDLEELKIYMYQALRYQELNNTIASLTDELSAKYDDDGLQGSSAAIRQVRSMIARLKNADASVVVTGESGTGKELVARALHFSGKRKMGRFVEVNCAAIPEGLLESEFFGYRKGAFTGAVQDTVGKFEQADGGTLFLDELGDMPLGLQAKFLRALQERSITPIGSSAPIRVDVRVVAATNQNLAELVRQGKFREDLYYRLHVMEICVPPLRERREDIMILCAFFLSQYAKSRDLPPFELTPDALDALIGYSYPGNVRQLFNILEFAALMCADQRITAANLPQEVLREKAPGPAGGEERLEELIADMPLRELERLAILATLKKNNGQKKRTAQKLGISDRNLRYKLQEYEGKPPSS